MPSNWPVNESGMAVRVVPAQVDASYGEPPGAPYG